MTHFLRGKALVLGLATLAMGSVSEAVARVPLAFPTDQRLVPFAVGAAFALPAVLALLFSVLMRFGRRIGAIGAVAVLVLVGLAIAGQLPTGLLRVAGS